MSGDFDELSIGGMADTVEQMKIENDQKQKALDALKAYTDFTAYKPFVQDEFDAVDLSAKPGSIVFATKYPSLVSSSAGTAVTWQKFDPIFESRKEEDKKLQTKLFIHFAQLFVTKYPKWQLQPEPEDPFHKVKLVRPDIGASITSMYPDNQVAVYGGPDIWTKQYAQEGSRLPVGLVQTHIFYGWALDVNVPDWVM